SLRQKLKLPKNGAPSKAEAQIFHGIYGTKPCPFKVRHRSLGGLRLSSQNTNGGPEPDRVIADIADYALNYEIASELAWTTARHCLIDTLGCGLEALDYPACTKLLGPIVPGTVVPNGACVPGTHFELDPVQAAFNIGAMNRWLDV